MLCHVTCVFLGPAVASRECSIWRVDRKPRKGSGHTEAHCHRERSTHATGEAHRCQTGPGCFCRTCNECNETSSGHLSSNFVLCMVFSIGKSWEDSRLIFIPLPLDHSSPLVYLVNKGLTSVTYLTFYPFSVLSFKFFFQNLNNYS